MYRFFTQILKFLIAKPPCFSSLGQGRGLFIDLATISLRGGTLRRHRAGSGLAAHDGDFLAISVVAAAFSDQPSSSFLGNVTVLFDKKKKIVSHVISS